MMTTTYANPAVVATTLPHLTTGTASTATFGRTIPTAASLTADNTNTVTTQAPARKAVLGLRQTWS